MKKNDIDFLNNYDSNWWYWDLSKLSKIIINWFSKVSNNHALFVKISD